MSRVEEIDNYFFLDILLVFLMINYNLPLATIYFAMVLLGSIMYYVAGDQRLFGWIPLMKKDNKVKSILIGVGVGIAFIWFYNYLETLTPLSTVFATTAFGESETISKFVFSFLIPIVETRFFFRTLMQWWAWKSNMPVSTPFSSSGIQLMAIFGAIFTVFHATAKGFTENLALIGTFIFGALSIFLILYFQELTQAVVAHIVVNSDAIGVFKAFGSGALLGSPYVIAGMVLIGYFLMSKRINLKRVFG